MPLMKKTAETQATDRVTTEQPSALAITGSPDAQQQDNIAKTETSASPKRLGGTRKAGDKTEAPMTKDDYWRRREERDVQRDKDMAWSGLAQAALQSVGLIQLNTDNTLEGLLMLVDKTVGSLLQIRDQRNR